MAHPLKQAMMDAGTWCHFVHERARAKLAGLEAVEGEEYLPPAGKRYRVIASFDGGLMVGNPPGAKTKKVFAALEEFEKSGGGVVGERTSKADQVCEPKVEKAAGEDASVAVAVPESRPAEYKPEQKSVSEVSGAAVEIAAPVVEVPGGGAQSLLIKAFYAVGGFDRLVKHWKACPLGSREATQLFTMVLEDDALRSGRQFADAGAETDAIIDDLLSGGPGSEQNEEVGIEGGKGGSCSRRVVQEEQKEGAA